MIGDILHPEPGQRLRVAHRRQQRIDLQHIVGARPNADQPGQDQVVEAGMEIMMAAVEPDDRLARFGVIILFQIQPIPLIMQRGILAQQAHIGAARHRPMGAAIVQQIGHAM